MENEIWKDVEGYDGDYLVSNFGKVKSFKKNKESILKKCKNSNGYYFVNLFKNNIQKKIYIHRLVGKEFIPNPENKPEINHLNADKSNNQVSNLEWVTPKQNIQHAWQTGLMENTRKAVKNAWKTGLMENTRKNIIKAYEAIKIPIYSKKLDMRFESCTEAAIYLQTHYFENAELGCLRTTIGRLLNNKIKKSKYDFSWEYVQQTNEKKINKK